MVEFRPAGLGVWFWVGFGVFVPFSTICLFFPSFNDDLGTMPTRRPYSWKKKGPCEKGETGETLDNPSLASVLLCTKLEMSDINKELRFPLGIRHCHSLPPAC